MANSSDPRSVVHYKRLIAAVIAAGFLALSALSIFLAVQLRDKNAALAEAQEEISSRDMEAQALEEAERLRNAVQPERVKPALERSAPEILNDSVLIAHALGSTDGNLSLNCLEGFREHYDAGIRVFEADLRMSADGHVILRHDWNPTLQEGIDATHLPTLDAFLSTPIQGQYTPLSFRDLLLLMAEYPDICVITDTKYTEPEAVTEQFRAMVADAHALGMSYLFDRMIVQVYSPSHFSVVDNVYHFPHYIYTLYQDYFGQSGDSFQNKVNYCAEHGIMGLTLNARLWEPDYASIADAQDIRVYIHTINDAGTARDYLHSGICAVYSDTLNPEDMGAD